MGGGNGVDDPRHPRIKEIPWEVPDNLDRDAFLFLGDPTGNDRSFINKIWIPMSTGVIGFSICMFANLVMKRPALTTGIHKTVLATLGGTALGVYLDKYKEEYCAERDMQMFHYICLHPEDFKQKKRVLFRDYLEPWVPFR